MNNFIKAFFQKVSRLARPQDSANTYPFTYYISGPPKRKTNYREKQFDQYLKEILGPGIKIISINTQTHTGPEQSGMWVLILLEGLTQKAREQLTSIDHLTELIGPAPHSHESELNLEAE